MIADMGADVKSGPVIGGLQRREHFEEVTERVRLARHNTAGALGPGKFRQQFRHGYDFDLGNLLFRREWDRIGDDDFLHRGLA